MVDFHAAIKYETPRCFVAGNGFVLENSEPAVNSSVAYCDGSTVGRGCKRQGMSVDETRLADIGTRNAGDNITRCQEQKATGCDVGLEPCKRCSDSRKRLIE
jgi:hypothetical protein